MYLPFLLNLYKRSLYHVTSVRSTIKRLNHVASKDKKKQEMETVSTKFPDYKVIYIFPFIKQARSINIVKHRFTIFIGITTPVIVGLHLTNILPFDITIGLITSGKILVNLFLLNN